MGKDPWLDGQLEDGGPASSERLGAIAATAAILGSVVLRGGALGLMSRWNRGSVGFGVVGIVLVLLRDPISGTMLSPLSTTGEVSTVAVGRLGWVFLGLAALVEGVFWALR